MQALDDNASTRGNGKFLLKCKIFSLIICSILSFCKLKLMDSHLLWSLGKGSLESITAQHVKKLDVSLYSKKNKEALQSKGEVGGGGGGGCVFGLESDSNCICLSIVFPEN